jgi:hypothetical protein
MSRFGIFALVLVVLFVSVFIIALAVFGRDVPEPDVSDLALERPAIPEEDNAFTVYDVATKSMHWPEDDTWVDDYLDGSPVEEAQVADFIEQNAEALNVIRQVHTQASYTFPVPDNSEMTYDHEAWQRMANLLAVKARHERLSGRYDEALIAVAALLHIGRHTHFGSESLVHYLTGERFTRGGVSQAADLAREQGLPRDRLDRLALALAQDFAVGEGLVRAYKGEYHTVQVVSDEFLGGMEDEIPTETTEPERYGFMFFLNFMFQPNRTKRDSAELHRQIIAMIPLTYGEARAQAPDKLKKWEIDEKYFAIAMMRPNVVGRFITSSSASAFPDLHASKCWTDSQIAGTRLLIALIRHRADTGTLPDDLQALVPQYIESIPADPFDGEPFRYSKEKGIVYSVGIDLIDSGGSTEPLDSQDIREAMWRYSVEDVVFSLS